MNRGTILTIALAAMLLLPAAAAYGPLEHSPSPQEAPSADDGDVTTESVASSPTDANTQSSGNYTRLYLDDQYRYDEVAPGNSTTFNITVVNGEDHAVELSPHAVLPQLETRPMQDSWISIGDANTTLGAGAERTFTVTVSVPEGTDLGDYQAAIAFTNETISYPARPPQPIHAATVSVEVTREPTVTVQSQSYYSTMVRAGGSHSYEVVVENNGESAVPLNPSVQTEESRYGERTTAERSWFEIDAPNEVAAGDNATVEITVNPPAEADIGRYDAMTDLGLQDPARADGNDYWQQIDLNFQVWQQPDEPFVTDFQVSDGTENVTLTLTAGQYRQSSTDRPASFDVTFVGPNGTVIDPQREQVTNRGSVSLASDARRGEAQGVYASSGENKRFVYSVDDPASGDWTVKIMPHDTTDFSYEIVRNES